MRIPPNEKAGTASSSQRFILLSGCVGWLGSSPEFSAISITFTGFYKPFKKPDITKITV
jgi:hypothetical protein